MNQTKLVDGIRVHNMAGTLASDIALRRRPRVQYAYRPTYIRRPTVVIQWPMPNIDTTQLRAILLAKSYSSFYAPPERAIHQMQLMAALASMLTNLIPPRYVAQDNVLVNLFEEAGMDVRYEIYRTAEDVERLLLDPAVDEFLESMGEDQRMLFFDDRDQQVLMVGIILLTMGKNVNPDNYSGWFRNRLRAFRGAMGILEERSCWSETFCPSQETMTGSYVFLSAAFTLRRHFFRICLAASRTAVRDMALFREVVMLMQGNEMNHLMLVDKYIINKYPELLRIRCLRDDLSPLNRALEFLQSVDEGDRYFVKILYSKDETSVLNRNNFGLLAAAALAAAQTETPSLKYYKGGNTTGTSGAVIEAVRQYLNLRMNLAYYSIAESPYAYMSQREVEKYINHAEGQGGAQLFELPVPTSDRQDPGRLPAIPVARA